jgi:hypothetical protein
MPAPVKNTNTQNITSLTYKINGINNSEEKISDAMTALFVGISQWGTYTTTGNIQTAINVGDITLDAYIAYAPNPGYPIVDTAGNILEKYA